MWSEQLVPNPSGTQHECSVDWTGCMSVSTMGNGLVWNGFSGVGLSWFGIIGRHYCQRIKEEDTFCSFSVLFFRSVRPFSYVLAIAVPLRRGWIFYKGLFSCFLIFSSKPRGGSLLGKVAMVTRFPCLQAGHLRCIKGSVSLNSRLPSSSCNSGMLAFWITNRIDNALSRMFFGYPQRVPQICQKKH